MVYISWQHNMEVPNQQEYWLPMNTNGPYQNSKMVTKYLLSHRKHLLDLSRDLKLLASLVSNGITYQPLMVLGSYFNSWLLMLIDHCYFTAHESLTIDYPFIAIDKPSCCSGVVNSSRYIVTTGINLKFYKTSPPRCETFQLFAARPEVGSLDVATLSLSLYLYL